VLRTTLPNGITVLARENWSAPSVVVEGYLLAGSLDEPVDLPGLASFTVGMLGRGTRRRSFAEINETVEAVGASVGYVTISPADDAAEVLARADRAMYARKAERKRAR